MSVEFEWDDAKRPSRNVMKKAPRRSSKPLTKGLRVEYELNHARSRPNRFASRLGPQTVAVVLDPDVAQVFDSSRVVNNLLRSVMTANARRASEQRGSRRKAG